MTKKEIRAELRRSACEDKDPWGGVGVSAFNEACDWRSGHKSMFSLGKDNLRIFFLLVAEAM